MNLETYLTNSAHSNHVISVIEKQKQVVFAISPANQSRAKILTFRVTGNILELIDDDDCGTGLPATPPIRPAAFI